MDEREREVPQNGIEWSYKVTYITLFLRQAKELLGMKMNASSRFLCWGGRRGCSSFLESLTFEDEEVDMLVARDVSLHLVFLAKRPGVQPDTRGQALLNHLRHLLLYLF